MEGGIGSKSQLIQRRRLRTVQEPVSKSKGKRGGRERGWRCSSVEEHLPSMLEALGSVLITARRGNNGRSESLHVEKNDLEERRARERHWLLKAVISSGP